MTPALAPAAAQTKPIEAKALAKPQKSPEMLYLEGLTCLQQSDTGCALVAQAGIPPVSAYAKILEAQLAATRQDFDSVLRLLIPLQAESGLLPQAIGSLHATLALAYENQENALRAIEQRCLAEPYLSDAAAVDANQARLWATLSGQPREVLLELRGEGSSSAIQGWVDLALAVNFNARPDQAISQWRQAYPDHPAGEALLARIASSGSGAAAPAAGGLTGKVAALLPLQVPAFAAAAEAIRSGLQTAHAAEQSSAELVFYSAPAEKEAVLSSYRQAIAEGAQYVIGPMTRDEVTGLNESGEVSVVTLALNQPELGKAQNEKLVTFGRPAEAEARQVADIGRLLGMQTAQVIHAGTPLGERMADSFIAAWKESGGGITHKAGFGAETDLAELRAGAGAHPADMIFLAADAEQARQVRPYLDQATPTFGTSHLYDGDPENPRNSALTAVHFVDMPWLVDPDNPQYSAYREAARTLPKGELQRWFAVGVDAWQLLGMLARGSRKPMQGLTGDVRWQEGIPQRTLTRAQFRNGGVAAEPLN